jgi:glyoxylase-like metal-dependent hydrolase (beta-lactamase superfamily II)
MTQTTRTITAIAGNTQRLDGGAMFGNAPRPVWEKWIAPDERNRIPLACRAMLVEETTGSAKRRILFETGIGAFFSPKMRDRFGVVESEHVLLESLTKAGAPHDTIDVVVLSHLHFDHAGGLLSAYEEGKPPTLLFPKATFVVGREAWERATHPHARDRASFIPELMPLLVASNRLEIVDGERSQVLGPAYRLHRSNGHTPGLVLAEVPSADGPIVFAADLIPGRPWVHLPITMGYDRAPEMLIDEKTALLEDLVKRNGRLFYTHDPSVAMTRVVKDAAGKFGPGEGVDAPDHLAIG